MRAQRQATWQRWSQAAFQLAYSRYAGLICHAARMLRRVGCIQKFTNLLRTFRISSLHPASGYLTPIGVDAGRLRGRQRREHHQECEAKFRLISLFRTPRAGASGGRTDRKSLLALRGVGPESEAESVRFHGRRVTKVGREVKQALEAAEQGCQRRTRALPAVSGGGERHDRFGVVVGERGRRATDRGSFRPGSLPDPSRQHVSIAWGLPSSLPPIHPKLRQ